MRLLRKRCRQSFARSDHVAHDTAAIRRETRLSIADCTIMLLTVYIYTLHNVLGVILSIGLDDDVVASAHLPAVAHEHQPTFGRSRIFPRDGSFEDNQAGRSNITQVLSTAGNFDVVFQSHTTKFGSVSDLK
jgi:hypothetical protein